MPLLKKKPFTLLEPTGDLEPRDLVYQVRFTKEIFQDYQEYLNRINLYRQRVWTCKISGKSNLTYEEALVSEKRATDKVQEIPKEIVAPALHLIQYSMLSLKDLANMICEKFKDELFVGAELYGRKDDDLCLCKILSVPEDGTGNCQYEVEWFDKNKKIMETALVNRSALVWKKLPFSRRIFKSFIRKSTYRSAPWAIHDKLAQKHGISNDLPQVLKGKVTIQNGLVVCNKKRKNVEDNKNTRDVEESRKRRKKQVEAENYGAENMEKSNGRENEEPKEEPLKYPIEDLLVQPGADDPVFTVCPSPTRDFKVQIECFGDLLMVWDFCSSFGRLLHLWPFSLEDFENAICHKDSNLILIVEAHSALLRLLVKDKGGYLLAAQNRNKKFKVTLINWTEYLCDFLEIMNIPDSSTYTSTIKRGHYGLLDAQVKLGILKELINQALESDTVREKLDEYIEERQVLGASRRGEALEVARKKREEKEQLKAKSVANGGTNAQDTLADNLDVLSNGNQSSHNGGLARRTKGDTSSQQENVLDKSEHNHLGMAIKKAGKKQSMDGDILAENVKDPSIKDHLKQMKDAKKGTTEMRTKEQRREYYEREMEKRVLRTNSLGKDRHYNRYWWFRHDGRIFVESCDSKLWGYYSSKEELDALMGSLNCKGERERSLLKQLEKLYSRICVELQKRSKEVAQKIALEEAVLRRSTRVRALPRESASNAFLRYVNKWKEDKVI